MQACQLKRFAELMCALGCLASIAAACGGDADPIDDAGAALDAGMPGGGATLDGATSGGGSDAAQAGPDGGTAQTGNDAGTSLDGGRPADSGSSNPDGSASTNDAAGPVDAGSDAGPGNDTGAALEKFSFFVTSLSAMRQLSGSQNGFGGNLTFGETGEGAGLRGADKICTTIAEMSMPGSGSKGWHAFLSTDAVDARDRIGDGPWYDRLGRIVAMTKQALLTGNRPQGAHSLIVNDLPNERGEPNQAGSAIGSNDDNHDVVTATNAQGAYDGTPTCGDWTTTTTTGAGMRRGPGLGHSWPAMSGQSWVDAHAAPGCAASVNLSASNGGGSGDGIGNAGGYGGIYCFADVP